MEALWNQLQLERPPNISWRTSAEKFDTRGFLNTIDHTIKELESQHALHSEAALLSRLIYRMKCKFRSDKGLKNMEKVNRALLNYLTLGLEKEYKNLRASVDTEEKLIVLPSKQMIQYTLVRTQGFAKLMCRLQEVAEGSATFFKSRIHLGHAWTMAIIAYAVVSRIWVLSKHLIKRSCIWYNGLYQYLDNFRIVGIPWNPDNLHLPIDLKTWLSLSWIDEDLSSIPKDANLVDTMFKLIIPQSDPVDYDLSVQDTDKTSTEKPQTCIPMDDVGECIDRESFMLSYNAKNTTTVNTAPKRKLINEDTTHEVVNMNFQDKTSKKKRKRMILDESHKSAENPEDSEIAINLLAEVTSKSDLIRILKQKSYPGVDKSRWKTIRKNGKQLLGRIDEGSTKKKQAKLLKTVVRTMQSWMD